MSEKFHMCNATNGDWAYISVMYYTTNCTLLRYDYADPYTIYILLSYIYYISYWFIFFFFFLFIIILFRKRYVDEERHALIAVHPAGYWAEMLQQGNPFRVLFGQQN